MVITATCTGTVFRLPSSPLTHVHKHVGVLYNLYCVLVAVVVYRYQLAAILYCAMSHSELL